MELLLVLDEQAVRNEALITFKIILSQINPQDFEAELMDLILKLGKSEYMSQRQSAVNLIPAVYSKMNQINKSILIR